jgi:amino acid adenylation domain-containing protein
LQRVREVALGAYAHQDVPFEQLVDLLQPERDLSRSPLFQVMFSLQQIADPAPTSGDTGLALHGLEVTRSSTKFDLTLTVLSNTQAGYASLAYNTDLFAPGTIQLLLERWLLLLHAVLAQPQRCLDEITLLTPQERHLVLSTWNETAQPYPESSLPRLLEQQVQRTPDALALVYQEEQFTFQALNRQANRLARYLGAGLKPEAPVGIYLEREAQIVVALLAVLKAGGAYVPLDTRAPGERVALMLADARVALLITREHLADQLSGPRPDCICVDTQRQAIAAQCADNLERAIQPAQAAYILYTSGSTGAPKGVVIEHRQLLNYLSALSARVGFVLPASFAMVQPLTVDSCLTMLFPPLLGGGSLHLLTREQTLDPLELARVFEQRPADYLKIAPSHLAALLGESQAAHLLPRRGLIIGGEASSWAWAQQVRARMPAGVLFNHYGPTETTVGSLVFQVEPGTEPVGITPTGRPLANTRVYILDRQGQLALPGVIGELYLGGAGLARGYLHAPDLTAARFLPDHLSGQPGARLYATGDLVRYRSTGNVEFVGRRDEQVKIRGYRIEPGEIEAALVQHPHIRAAVVLAVGPQGAGRRLVAALVPQVGATLTEQQVQQFLRGRLPEYMQPTRALCLEALPLTPHGKVDRKALLALFEQARPDGERPLKQPRTSVEELIAGVWREILGQSEIGRDENFFGLGGHSLLAVQVLSRLRALFGRELPLRALFQAPTIASLAAVLSGPALGTEGQALPALVPQPRSGSLPLSFAQQRLWYLHQLAPTSSAYLMPQRFWLPGALDQRALQASLAALLARHESLRTAFGEQADQPCQQILPTLRLLLPLIDLDGLPARRAHREARHLSEQEGVQPMQIGRAPLLRAALLRLGGRGHLLLLTLHHLIADGWSLRLLWRDWRRLYQQQAHQEVAALPELTIQYADYALWQRNWLRADLLEQRLDYWRRQLGGASQVNLPARQPAALPGSRTRQGRVVHFHFEHELSAQVWQGSEQHTVTPFVLLLTGLYAQLSRTTGQRDLLVGTDSANRQARECEEVVGCFVNLLPLRVQLGRQESFEQALMQAREALVEGSRQELPFELLVERLGLGRGESAVPLVRVLLVWQGFEVQEAGGQDSQGGQGEEERAAKFDLAIFAWRRGEEIAGMAIYQEEKLERAGMQALLTGWQRQLAAGLREPQVPLTRLELQSADELARQQLLEQEQRTGLRGRRGRRFELPEGRPATGEKSTH